MAVKRKARSTAPAASGSNNQVSQKATAQPVAQAGSVFVCSHLNRGVIFDMPDGRRIKVTGVNDVLRGKEHGKLIVGGGVYTKMAEDDWAHISKTFAELPMIKNGLLYAEKSPRDAKAAINERKELRNGFEPVNPNSTKTKATTAAAV